MQRWLKFSKYLRDFGWEPIIYTPEVENYAIKDESLLKDIHKDQLVLKTPIWEPYGIYKMLTGSKDSQTVSFLNEEKKPGLMQKASQWIRGNFFIPDSRVFWVKPSIAYLSKYLTENKIDALVTTGPPHSLHLIGLGLKKKLGIKWLADFRDPWTNIDYYEDLYLTRWADRKQKQQEHSVLRSADIVVSVGYTLAEELKILGANNCQVITNGYDHEDYDLGPSSIPQEFTFTHVGLLSGPRSHKALWRAFANLIKENKEAQTDLKIKLVGKTDISVIEDIKESGIYSNLEKVKYVKHEEVAEIQRNSFLLLLPVNRTPNSKGIVSGKIFEYLASGRPTLCIGDTDGDAARILDKANSGHTFHFDDEKGITDFLKRKYSEFKQTQQDYRPVNVKEYSRKALTQKMAELLNQLSN